MKKTWVKLQGNTVQYALVQLGNTCTSLSNRWVGLPKHPNTRTARTDTSTIQRGGL